jgi:hypothetical protein
MLILEFPALSHIKDAYQTGIVGGLIRLPRKPLNVNQAEDIHGRSQPLRWE